MTELWYVLSVSIAAVSASVALVTWRALDFADKLDRRERGIVEPEPKVDEEEAEDLEGHEAWERRIELEEDRAERLQAELEHARELDEKARDFEKRGRSNDAQQFRLMAYESRERAKKLGEVR